MRAHSRVCVPAQKAVLAVFPAPVQHHDDPTYRLLTPFIIYHHLATVFWQRHVNAAASVPRRVRMCGGYQTIVRMPRHHEEHVMKQTLNSTISRPACRRRQVEYVNTVVCLLLRVGTMSRQRLTE